MFHLAAGEKLAEQVVEDDRSEARGVAGEVDEARLVAEHAFDEAERFHHRVFNFIELATFSATE